MERILAEIERRACALMCAEEDPLECHRFLMICPELARMGIQPFHIRKGSKIEDQVTAENRLLEANGFGDIATCTLFPQARAEALEKAYELQAGKFAYRVDAATEGTKPKPFVFVLMPFDPSFDDIYKFGIKSACEAAGAYCERVNEQLFQES